MQPKFLASGNGTTTLTMTLTADVPGIGSLQAIFAEILTPADGATSIIQFATDSQGHPWLNSNTGVQESLIGLSREVLGPPHPDTTIQVGSSGRTCVAGDLHAGDTVTLTFSFSPGPSTVCHSSALLVYLPTSFRAVAQNGSLVTYGNSLKWPDFDGEGGTSTSLTWKNPPAVFNNYPSPNKGAWLITAMGAYPPSTFTPGARRVRKIGEITSGVASIASSVAVVGAGTFVDPGGTWSSPAQVLSGNYQFDFAPGASTFWIPRPFRAVS